MHRRLPASLTNRMSITQERKQELMREFADGNLPPPKTRSFSGHTLDQAQPVEAPASHP